jgi:hypothetical protein
MNQKGEGILFCLFILVVLSGLLTLCGLELERSFRLLQKRTHLFLCVKETKLEIYHYLKLNGRTNWALNHLAEAQLVAMFIPGLQGMALNAEKLKKALKTIQNVTLATYLNKMTKLKMKGCPIDHRMVITPFILTLTGYQRGAQGQIKLRRQKWTYSFVKPPYQLQLAINAESWESPHPVIRFQAKETGVILSSLSYSP